MFDIILLVAAVLTSVARGFYVVTLKFYNFKLYAINLRLVIVDLWLLVRAAS
jgi:hypothetical protein